MKKNMRMLVNVAAAGVVTVIVMQLAGGVLTAEKDANGKTNFAVETQVFVAESQKPSSSNTTVFNDGVIYDYPRGENFITVLDTTTREIVLLDPELQVKARITLDQLKLYESWLADIARRQDDPLLRFCVEPDFKIQQNDDQMSFQSPLITYTATRMIAQEKEAVEEYRQFTDWYARLNSLLNPRALPPAARLTVNEHLARGRVVPGRIDLYLAPHARFGGNSLKLRSVHQWRDVTPKEMDRINATQLQIKNFRAVPLDEFRRQAN